MSRTTIQAERILPYASADLCRLVGDVRAYPEFIPWLQRLRVIREEKRDEGGWEGLAEAIVGWKAITEKFSTNVRCEPAKGEVDVALVSGPFHALENRWRFEPHEGGAKVRFWISYQFKNPVLNAVVAANKDKVAGRIMAAFEREAQKRLGQKPHH